MYTNKYVNSCIHVYTCTSYAQCVCILYTYMYTYTHIYLILILRRIILPYFISDLTGIFYFTGHAVRSFYGPHICGDALDISGKYGPFSLYNIHYITLTYYIYLITFTI